MRSMVWLLRHAFISKAWLVPGGVPCVVRSVVGGGQCPLFFVRGRPVFEILHDPPGPNGPCCTDGAPCPRSTVRCPMTSSPAPPPAPAPAPAAAAAAAPAATTRRLRSCCSSVTREPPGPCRRPHRPTRWRRPSPVPAHHRPHPRARRPRSAPRRRPRRRTTPHARGMPLRWTAPRTRSWRWGAMPRGRSRGRRGCRAAPKDPWTSSTGGRCGAPSFGGG